MYIVNVYVRGICHADVAGSQWHVLISIYRTIWRYFFVFFSIIRFGYIRECRTTCVTIIIRVHFHINCLETNCYSRTHMITMCVCELAVVTLECFQHIIPVLHVFLTSLFPVDCEYSTAVIIKIVHVNWSGLMWDDGKWEYKYMKV